LEGLPYTIHQTKSDPGVHSPALAQGTVEVLQALRPDVLHLDSFDGDSSWWQQRPGKPKMIALTMHGANWGKVLTRWNDYRLGNSDDCGMDWKGLRSQTDKMHTFDRVIAVSLHEQWMIQQLDGCLSTRLVYNPIAPAYFAPRVDCPAGAPFMAMASRWPKMAERAAAESGMPLDIIEGVPSAKMPAVYDAHRALVLPTLWAQGYDTVIAESLARGRPVLAFASGSTLMDRSPGVSICEMGRPDVLGRMMAEPLPHVPEGVADRFRPERHAAAWLEAVQ
jgi:glycosyltransferase involved in cell wall biosynthesis